MEQKENQVKVTTKLENDGKWNLYLETIEDYNALILQYVNPEKVNKLMEYISSDFHYFLMNHLRAYDKTVIEEAETLIKEKYQVESIKIRGGVYAAPIKKINNGE